MDTWFEILICLFAFVYIMIELFKCTSMIEEIPPLTEETRNKMYS